MSKLYEALKMAEAERAKKEGGQENQESQENQENQKKRVSIALHINSFFLNAKDGSGENRPSAREEKGGFVPQHAKPLPNNEGGEGQRGVSIINQGMTVRGNIQAEGNLTVRGYVEGSVSLTREVVIEAGAEVQADVSAGWIIVGGSMKGNLTALETVEVLPTGKVQGNIRAKALFVHEGASITGGVQVGAPPNNMVKDLNEEPIQTCAYAIDIEGVGP